MTRYAPRRPQPHPLATQQRFAQATGILPRPAGDERHTRDRDHLRQLLKVTNRSRGKAVAVRLNHAGTCREPPARCPPGQRRVRPRAQRGHPRRPACPLHRRSLPRHRGPPGHHHTTALPWRVIVTRSGPLHLRKQLADAFTGVSQPHPPRVCPRWAPSRGQQLRATMLLGGTSLATTMDGLQKGRASGTWARPFERLTPIPQDSPPRLVGRPCASASNGKARLSQSESGVFSA